MNFLDYYRENLAHIRSLSAEFAAEFPKIAARLELSGRECKDPYVERLLEGTAFLAARVEKKLDDGQPRLLESILGSVAPAFTTPVPSFCILNLTLNHADGRLAQGLKMDLGSRFTCQIPGMNTPCTYSTLHDYTLFPLEVSEVNYNTRELKNFENDGIHVQAALELTLQITSKTISDEAMVDYLDFYITLPENESSLLQCQLMADIDKTYINKNGRYHALSGVHVEIPNCYADTNFLFNCQTGIRNLQRFLCFPQSFKYIRIHGMRRAFQERDGNAVKLAFTLKRRENDLSKQINNDSLKLWCIPAVNVFRKRTDRNFFSGNYEQHLIPDRTAPQDYEIFRIISVEAYNERNETLFNCYPFGRVSYDERIAEGNSLAFFTPHRRARFFASGKFKRSSYSGTEVFVSISGDSYDKCWEDIQQYSAVTLCTNRDLPLLLRQSDPVTPPQGYPILEASFMVPPSRPLLPANMSGDATSWSRVAHISFNLSSALWKLDEYPTGLLQFFFKSYASENRESVERMADGIISIKSSEKTFRFIKRGCVYYETGYAIDLTLATANYVGTGYFLFAHVVFCILRTYTPINSCLEMTLHTDKRREIMSWRM